MPMTTWLWNVTGAGIMAAALLCCGCSKKGTGGGDVAPPPAPAPVNDLRIAATAPEAVTLEWTAPVSDENHGSVDYYDVRYTDFEPDENSWQTATQAEGEPGSAPAGFTQTMTIAGLTPGATYYFALKCCGEASCSDVSNLTEATLPLEFEVAFPDAALEAAIRARLGQPTGPILYSAVLTITDLGADGDGIRDLTGLEYCEHLQFLMLLGNPIENFSPIAQLHELWMLNLIETGLSDVSVIGGLTSLAQLHFSDNTVQDISALAPLTNLQVLTLHNNDVTDIDALAGMTALTAVDLENNNVADISPLVANTGIGDGDEIDLRNNPLSDVSRNTHIPALEARGVTLHY